MKTGPELRLGRFQLDGMGAGVELELFDELAVQGESDLCRLALFEVIDRDFGKKRRTGQSGALWGD